MTFAVGGGAGSVVWISMPLSTSERFVSLCLRTILLRREARSCLQRLRTDKVRCILIRSIDPYSHTASFHGRGYQTQMYLQVPLYIVSCSLQVPQNARMCFVSIDGGANSKVGSEKVVFVLCCARSNLGFFTKPNLLFRSTCFTICFLLCPR